MKDSICPQCGHSGKSVKALTLRSLFKESTLRNLGEQPHFFCQTADCPIVYFDEAGDSRFDKSDLTVRVGIKETEGPRPVCYCFNHSIEEIENEIRETGETTVLNDIKERMQKGCWCETKSPMGSCCLAVVSREVKSAKARLETATPIQSSPNNKENADCCTPLNDSPEDAGQRKSRAGLFAMLGSLFSAILASTCCWLPLVLIAFGVSGAAVGATMETYRPWFLGTAFLLLGTAFYFAYGRNTRVTETDKDCCAASENGSGVIQKVNRSMLWLVTVAVAVFALFPRIAGSLFKDSDDSEFNPAHLQIAIPISGMTCEACAINLDKKLETVPGVANARVDYATKQAVVAYPPDGDAPSEKDLQEAISSLGYSVTPNLER